MRPLDAKEWAAITLTAAANGNAVGRPAKDPAPPPPDVAAHRDWAGVLDPLSRLTDVSFRFLPLEDARLALDALDAARARLKARVAELTGPGVRPGDWDAPEDGGEA